MVAIAVIGSLAALHSYRSSTSTSDYTQSAPGVSPNSNNYILIAATVLSVTPENQEADVRLEFSPMGKYSQGDLDVLTTPVTVVTTLTVGGEAGATDFGCHPV